MKRRLVSILTALALCLSLCPAGVLANEKTAKNVKAGETRETNPGDTEIPYVYGTLNQNGGDVSTVAEGGVVVVNEDFHNVGPNRTGFILSNGGTVKYNKGEIEGNSTGGTVENNYGTVSSNHGRITTNNGYVGNNYGLVDDNSGTGTITNHSGGRVIDNAGVVFNRQGGTVKNNKGGTVWWQFIVTGEHAVLSETESVTYIREGCTVTAEEGYYFSAPPTAQNADMVLENGAYTIKNITAAPVALTVTTDSIANAAALVQTDDGAETYYATIKDAWAAAQVASPAAAITLLADATLTCQLSTSPVGDNDLTPNITFNGGDHTVTGVPGQRIFSVDSGSTLTITGGTFKAKPDEQGRTSGCVDVQSGGTLNVTGGILELEGTTGYMLIARNGSTTRLSGGTFTGSANPVLCSDGLLLKDLLLNYGSKTGPHYAFYQGTSPYAPEGSSLPSGTFTVGECEHDGVTPTSNNDGTHALDCPYCGDNDTAANCTYAFSGTTGACTACGNSVTVTVSGTDNLIYDGTEKKPGVTVTRGATPLTADTDYTVAYADNVNAGTAKVAVTIGENRGTCTQTFTIGRAALTVDGTGIAKGAYGDTLSALTVEGLTARLNGAVVNGAWALTGETVPNVGDSGEYTAIFTPSSGAGNYNELTAPVTLDISKADYTGTKNASTSCKCGKTGTYELAGLLPAGYVLGTVTITDSHGIFDGTPTVNGTALAYGLADNRDNAGETGTIIVPVASAANYNAFDLTIVVTVETTEVTLLPDPPAAEDGKQYQVVMEDGISEVPAGLQGIETLDTPEKLESAMKTAITQSNSSVPQDNAAVYDVELQVSTDGGGTWIPATKENFPKNGLTVTLPYPAGTDSSYTFTVVHMFTTGDFGKTPGDTETPAVTNTEKGMRFTVTGLSPISVGWVQSSTPVTPVTPSKPSGGSGGGGGGASRPNVVQKPNGGEPKPLSDGFADLGSVGMWYYDAVEFVLQNGLMNGFSSTLFGPNENLSRAQLAQILYNKEGKPSVTGSGVFADVDSGAWYAPAITWAAGNGIAGGYGDGTFGPDDPITREQLAAMLWRYAGNPAATNKELHFTDADSVNDYALEAMRWAVENGVINGMGGGVLDPQGLATRAQTAQMLKNFIEQ